MSFLQSTLVVNNMSSSAGADLQAVKRFDGKKNFHLWKRAMVLLFKKKEVWGIVSGDEIRPTVNTNKERDLWDKKDTECQTDIYLCVDTSVQEHLLSATTAAQMWTKLLSIYEKKNDAETQMVLGEFYLVFQLLSFCLGKSLITGAFGIKSERERDEWLQG